MDYLRDSVIETSLSWRETVRSISPHYKHKTNPPNLLPECGQVLDIKCSQDSWESLGQRGDQTSQCWGKPWIFIGRTDAEAKAPILWPKSWFSGKDSDAGKDWGQGVTEDEMVERHHQHESEQTLGDREGQGSLVCCHSWGCKELDMTEWLNSSNMKQREIAIGKYSWLLEERLLKHDLFLTHKRKEWICLPQMMTQKWRTPSPLKRNTRLISRLHKRSRRKKREETQQKNVHKIRTGNSQKEKSKWLRGI